MGAATQRFILLVELDDDIVGADQPRLHVLALHNVAGVHVVNGLIEIDANGAKLPRQQDDFGAGGSGKCRPQTRGFADQPARGLAWRQIVLFAKTPKIRVLLPGQADSESDRFVARVPLYVVQIFGLVGARFAPRANCREPRLARPARAHKGYVPHNPYPAINPIFSSTFHLPLVHPHSSLVRRFFC